MFALVFISLSLGCAGAERPARSVILITIDTLRPDHLGCYGYTSIQTPNIDRLAREGALFTHAYTPVPITLPAHTALMTGEFPFATGVHDFSGNRLAPGAATIARTLRDHGYATAAFIGSAVLDSRFGLNQGFDTYFDHFEFGRLEEVHLDAIERRGDRVVDEALKWLKLNPRQPFFLWVHLYDPHAPYNPPEPYALRYRGRPYDGEIAFADAQVGRLLDFFERQGLENSLIALASDHGEGLGEHGEKTHGFFIYNSTLHVPLIVRVPGAIPQVIPDEVSLVDVMPTLLQAAGISIPSSVQGRSLLAAILGRTDDGPSNLYAESYPPLLHFGWNRLESLQRHGLKYIDTTRPELYDTRTDPKELHNLFQTRQAVAQEMSDRLKRLVSRFTPAASGRQVGPELNHPAMLESLRSLGYVAVSVRSVTSAGRNTLPDPKDRIQVYELVSAAMTDSQHGRYHESLRELQEAEKTEPDSLTVDFLVARDYLDLSDFQDAVKYFESVLKHDPSYATAAYYLGLSQLKAGDLDGVEESFDPSSCLSGPTVSQTQLDLRYPQFCGVTPLAPPWANSTYHSYQLRVEHRFSKGLQFLATYTISKSIDNASVKGGETTWLGGFTHLQDPNNFKLERSLSEYDIPQNLTFSYVYQLPVGRGRRWGANWNRWTDSILGGWQTNGFWRIDNGFPIALGLSGGQPLPTYGGQQPNLVGPLGRNGSDPSKWVGTNGQYFANPQNAVVPPPFTLGNAPRELPNLRLPGTNTAALSIFKEIPTSKLREGSHFEFRAESFNAFNHPQFGCLDATVNTGDFGQMSCQQNSPREIQLGLKFYF